MSLQNIVQQFRGKSPDEIAQMVRLHKIKGRMGTTYKCPMALLLNGIDTGTYVIGRRFIARVSGRKIERTRTPDGVASFVRKFDIGGYPDLVAPPPRCIATGSGGGSARSGVSNKPRKRKKEIKNHLAKLVGRFA